MVVTRVRVRDTRSTPGQGPAMSSNWLYVGVR